MASLSNTIFSTENGTELTPGATMSQESGMLIRLTSGWGTLQIAATILLLLITYDQGAQVQAWT